MFILIISIFAIFFMFSLRPKKLNQSKEINNGEYVSTDQFFQIIDLMRDKNVISTKEHTHLIVKMNPYLK